MIDNTNAGTTSGRDRVANHNRAVDEGTLDPDPRFDAGHPLHDIVCGWCGKIHEDISGYPETLPTTRAATDDTNAGYRAGIEAAARVVEDIASAQAAGWDKNPSTTGCGGAIAAANTGYFCSKAIAALTPAASEATAIGAGWKLVPIEPTEAMVEAARNYRPLPIDQRLRVAWADMLAASPKVASDTAPGVEQAVALVRRIASKESWQSHYGRTWEDEAVEIVAALAAKPIAGMDAGEVEDA